MERRDFLRLSALAATGLAIDACRPKAGTPAEITAAEPTDIPISQRVLMPQEMITATQEAGKSKSEGQPNVNNIRIVRELINPCQMYEGPGGDGMWGGWLVRLENSGYYLKNGKFSIEKQTSNGVPIGKVGLPDMMLPSNVDFFIPAVTIGLLSQQVNHSGGNSKLGQLNLKIERPTWSRVDDSVREYNFRVTLPSNPLSYVPLRSTSTGPAQLQLNLEVENLGEVAIGNVGGLAIATDSNGNLIDILGIGMLTTPIVKINQVVPYGQKRKISFTSIAHQLSPNNIYRTYTCAPTISDNTNVTYWVYFTTRTGMPVVHQDSVALAISTELPSR